MATARQQLLALLRQQEQGLRDDFARIAAHVRTRLLASDNADGVITPDKWRQLEQEITAYVISYYLGVLFQPFDVGVDGTLHPRSVFMRRMWDAIISATGLAVAQQALILNRRLSDDLTQTWSRAELNPFLNLDLLPASARKQYQDFQPQYAVTRADHKVLYDRVIAAAAETRRKLALYLREQFARTQTAKAMADALTTVATQTLTFDASRLLATETAFAFNRAAIMGASLNPFIVEVEVFTSPSHKHTDGCDEFVRGNPYLLEHAPIPPYHSHCLCGLRFHAHRQTQAVAEQLRGSNLLRVKGVLSKDFASLLLRGGGVIV